METNSTMDISVIVIAICQYRPILTENRMFLGSRYSSLAVSIAK